MENAKLLIFESDNLNLRGSSLSYIITEVWQTITIWEKMQNSLFLKGPSDLAWVFWLKYNCDIYSSSSMQ